MFFIHPMYTSSYNYCSFLLTKMNDNLKSWKKLLFNKSVTPVVISKSSLCQQIYYFHSSSHLSQLFRRVAFLYLIKSRPCTTHQITP